MFTFHSLAGSRILSRRKICSAVPLSGLNPACSFLSLWSTLPCFLLIRWHRLSNMKQGFCQAKVKFYEQYHASNVKDFSPPRCIHGQESNLILMQVGSWCGGWTLQDSTYMISLMNTILLFETLQMRKFDLRHHPFTIRRGGCVKRPTGVVAE